MTKPHRRAGRLLASLALFLTGSLAFYIGVIYRINHPKLNSIEVFWAKWPLIVAALLLGLYWLWETRKRGDQNAKQ